MTKPSLGMRLAYLASAAVAAVAASIVLPTAVITAQAVIRPNVGEITDFASKVAEPLGLLGAILATYGIARSASRRPGGRNLIPWVGAAAAAGMIGAALWVPDADLWTAAATILLPGVALLAGRNSRAPVGALEPPPAPVALRPGAPPLTAAGADREDARGVR